MDIEGKKKLFLNIIELSSLDVNCTIVNGKGSAPGSTCDSGRVIERKNQPQLKSNLTYLKLVFIRCV